MFFLFYLLLTFSVAALAHESILSFVVLDEQGLRNAIGQAMRLHSHSVNHWSALSHKILSIPKEMDHYMSVQLKQNLTELMGVEISVHKTIDIPIRRFTPRDEWTFSAKSVVSILDSLEAALIMGMSHDNTTVASVVFGGPSAVHLTPGSFFEIFKRVHWHTAGRGSEICLPSKSSTMTHASDWRDLQIFVGSASDDVLNFIAEMRDTFMSYAARPAFAMPEPRPAILEAIHVGGAVDMATDATHKVTTRFFLEGDICTAQHGAMHGGECTAGKSLLMTILCHHPPEQKFAMRACLSISGAGLHDWKEEIDTSLGPSLSAFLRVGRPKWNTRLPHGMHHGVQRFRNNISATQPGKYCWDVDSRDAGENVATPVRYIKGQAPIRASAPSPQVQSHTFKVAVVSGAYASGASLAKFMQQHLSKMYYADRHGYEFHLDLSNKFVSYFHDDIVPGRLKDGNMPYMLGVMSKVLMMLDMMYTHASKDWLFFTDEDVHINAQWLHLSLDAFLEDVPDDKLFVHTNYRSLMSGAFFLRNNADGRALVRDWIAVVMSGVIHCHGYDQAALEVLFFLRQVRGDQNKWTMRPFDFDCMESSFSLDGKNGSGCTRGASWSCDYEFEKKLLELGFLNKHRPTDFYKSRFSSYSRGCANGAIRDFHVVAETALRPRLQCFHCTHMGELGSPVWDGVLGGGNDALHSGAMDAYFTNHKVDWLFHEQYLQANACKKREDFIPACHTGENAAPHSSEHSSKLLSLFDGIAYHFLSGKFCRVSEYAAQRQRDKTWMKEYPDVIAAAARYSEEEWQDAYKTQGGGESRVHCDASEAHRKDDLEYCGLSDGLKFPNKIDANADQLWKWVLDDGYCSACQASSSQRSWPDDPQRLVVDCSYGEYHVRTDII